MSDVADYNTDILLWSERQAAILRDLKTRAPGISNELDVENLAEEIEGVGRSEFRAFESYLVQIFVHLMKAASNPDPVLRNKWASEIFWFQIQARKAMTPSMLHRLDIDDVWKEAIVKAQIELKRYDEDLTDVPASCPFGAEMFLVTEPLEVETLITEMSGRYRDERTPDAK